MGYRFSIYDANLAAHLANGNLMTFLDTIKSSEGRNENNTSLAEFFSNLNNDFITTNSDIQRILCKLAVCASSQADILKLLPILQKFQNHLRNLKIKVLLVPGFEQSKINKDLISRDFLKDLVGFYSEDPCLIMQLKEIPDSKTIFMYNAFQQIGHLLKNIDEWPGILIWNESDSIFISLEKDYEDVLYAIFRIIHFEQNVINYLKLHFQQKRKKKAILLHLSDLHLGAINSHQLARFYKIMHTERNNIYSSDPNAFIYPIITGDLVDTPSKRNKTLQEMFRDNLWNMGFQDPIMVQGNHDVRFKGFINGFHLVKKFKSLFNLNERQIHPIDQLKLAIIKIDSTVGGNLARGKIGQEQLRIINNDINRAGLSGYTYLAILHHHLQPIPDPPWLSKKLYEKALDKVGIDADCLIDCNEFIRWAEEKEIPFVLHGHKHIPYFNEHSGIKIVACGSSTGHIDHVEDGLTYMSYNRLTYDINSQKITSCTWCYEESAVGGIQHLQTQIF